MPKNPDRAAAVIVEEGRVLLIQRTKPGEEYLVVPGGKVEPGESPEEACAREAREEVNLDVEVGELLDSFGDEGRTQHFFRATRVGGEVRLGDGPERARATADNGYEPVWVPVEELDDVEVRPGEARRIIERAAR